MDLQALKIILSRKKETHKFNFGHVLVIGGSSGMVGAPFLAALSALRTGAGLVTIASSDEVIQKLEKRVLEIMTLSLPSNQAESIEKILNFIKARKVNTVIYGPGIIDNIDILNSLIKEPNICLVIDGGGLDQLKDNLDALENKDNSNIILTPHLGEFARLINLKLEETVDIKKQAINFSNKYVLNIVLKSHKTIVMVNGNQIHEDGLGGPELATAGSGDVLSGIIGGLVAQGMSPSTACINGVYLHSLVGSLAKYDLTEPSVIASDLITYIPKAYKQIENSFNSK